VRRKIIVRQRFPFHEVRDRKAMSGKKPHFRLELIGMAGIIRQHDHRSLQLAGKLDGRKGGGGTDQTADGTRQARAQALRRNQYGLRRHSVNRGQKRPAIIA
jgi:hypothetical protein